jgi:hypothetical protein
MALEPMSTGISQPTDDLVGGDRAISVLPEDLGYRILALEWFCQPPQEAMDV